MEGQSKNIISTKTKEMEGEPKEIIHKPKEITRSLQKMEMEGEQPKGTIINSKEIVTKL
jgi:hypothetical protein